MYNRKLGWYAVEASHPLFAVCVPIITISASMEILMTLTNYWWLLIWLFFGGALASYLPKRQELVNGRTEKRWSVTAAILMVLPYIIWAGTRKSFGDTHTYRRGFQNAPDDLSLIPGLFLSEQKDPGYTAFLILMKCLIGNNEELYFTIIALFQLLSMAFVFRKYSDDYWTCIFLFVVSTDYLSWMHNGMRQFIAVTIIFAGFRYLVEKQYIKMILLILVASQFHGSALIMLPIIFVVQGDAWNGKSLLMLTASAVFMAVFDRFSPLLNELLQETQYNDMMTNEIWSTDDGTNIIRVAVYSVPALVSLLGLKYIRAANNPAMNICVNCSIVTMALYLVASVSSGIYIGRLPIYTTLHGYMALPWMINQMFDKPSARLVRLAMYAAYLFFFYYQMAITWNAL